MEGVARVLSPDGRFIFTYDPYIPGHPTNGEKETMYSVNVYRNTSEEIEGGLRQSGLEVVRDELFALKPNRDDAYQARFVVAR